VHTRLPKFELRDLDTLISEYSKSEELAFYQSALYTIDSFADKRN